MLREAQARELDVYDYHMHNGINHIEAEYEDPLDDVFGSDGDEEAASHPSGEATLPPLEQSEIPRLRSTHVTNGYREGLSESKPTYIQEGFDEGYSLGALLGFKAAWLLAILTRLASISQDEVDVVKARSELHIGHMLSADYFSEDGIWSYAVPGAEDELDFQKVSDAHPVIAAWAEVVLSVATSHGVDLILFATKTPEDR